MRRFRTSQNLESSLSDSSGLHRARHSLSAAVQDFAQLGILSQELVDLVRPPRSLLLPYPRTIAPPSESKRAFTRTSSMITHEFLEPNVEDFLKCNKGSAHKNHRAARETSRRRGFYEDDHTEYSVGLRRDGARPESERCARREQYAPRCIRGIMTHRSVAHPRSASLLYHLYLRAPGYLHATSVRQRANLTFLHVDIPTLH